MPESTEPHSMRDLWQYREMITWPLALISGVSGALHVMRSGGGPFALLADIGACGIGVFVGFGAGLWVVGLLEKRLKRKADQLAENVFGLIFALIGAALYLSVFQNDIHGVHDKFYYVLLITGIAVLVVPFIVLFYRLSRPRGS